MLVFDLGYENTPPENYHFLVSVIVEPARAFNLGFGSAISLDHGFDQDWKDCKFHVRKDGAQDFFIRFLKIEELLKVYLRK